MKLKKIMKGEPAETERTDSVTEKQGYDELKWRMYETHLLVAVLIATVTFAAAFTMPGGYNGDGPDRGMPNLIDKAAFKAFVVFDTIAFGSSVATVYLLFYASVGGYNNYHNSLYLAFAFIFMAMLGMALAFVSGMYVMLAESIGLAISAKGQATSRIL